MLLHPLFAKTLWSLEGANIQDPRNCRHPRADFNSGAYMADKKTVRQSRAGRTRLSKACSIKSLPGLRVTAVLAIIVSFRLASKSLRRLTIATQLLLPGAPIKVCPGRIR